MDREKVGRRPSSSEDGTSSSSSMSGGEHWIVAEEDDEEIECPRLEDSRTSLQLPLPPELALLVPSQRQLPPLDPLLSSTMMQDPAGQSSMDAAAQDWPNASSIRLGKSDANWGNDSNSLSDRLNNAGISLDDDAEAADVSALSAAAAARAGGNDTSEVVVSGFDTDSSIASEASTNPDVSSPRLRVLAGDSELQRLDEEPSQQPHAPPQPPLALGLLQVCRLTLDVLSEGGLLRDEARRWLTPELLCDKLCDRIYCPMTQPTGAAAAAAPSADGSSVAAPLEFESPVGRVRHWLLADGGGGGGGVGGSPLRRRHVTNSV